MAIFKYELRQMRTMIIAWAVGVSALLFCILPSFLSIFINANGTVKTDVVASAQDNSFLKAVDMSAEFLSKPIGMYGFLTGWVFGIACGIIALHIGLSIHTKEFSGRTADFLLTKPYSRASIFISKLLSASTAVLIIGAAYFCTSYIALKTFLGDAMDVKLFALLAGSVILNSVLYMAFGIFLGVVVPRIRQPLLVSVTVVFITIVIGQLAVVAGTDILLYLSPPKFFGGSIVASLGHYEIRFVIWLIFLVTVFLTSAFAIFRKKDIYVKA